MSSVRKFRYDFALQGNFFSGSGCSKSVWSSGSGSATLALCVGKEQYSPPASFNTSSSGRQTNYTKTLRQRLNEGPPKKQGSFYGALSNFTRIRNFLLIFLIAHNVNLRHPKVWYLGDRFFFGQTAWICRLDQNPITVLNPFFFLSGSNFKSQPRKCEVWDLKFHR